MYVTELRVLASSCTPGWPDLIWKSEKWEHPVMIRKMRGPRIMCRNVKPEQNWLIVQRTTTVRIESTNIIERDKAV